MKENNKQKKTKDNLSKQKLDELNVEDNENLELVVSGDERKEASIKMKKLEEMVDASLKEFTHKRDNKQNPALIAKVFTSFLSAVITVLLGLNLGDFSKENPALLTNIALGISAFMTVISVWNSFHDYNDLFVQYTKIVSNLEILQKDISYLKEGKPYLTLEEVEERKAQYFEALRDNADFLYSVKAEDNTRS